MMMMSMMMMMMKFKTKQVSIKYVKKNIQPTRIPCGILCNRHIKVSSLLLNGTCSKLYLKLNVRYIRAAILNTFIRSFWRDWSDCQR